MVSPHGIKVNCSIQVMETEQHTNTALKYNLNILVLYLSILLCYSILLLHYNSEETYLL